MAYGLQQTCTGPEGISDPALNQRSVFTQKRSKEKQQATKQGCILFLDSVLVPLIEEALLNHPPLRFGRCPTLAFAFTSTWAYRCPSTYHNIMGWVIQSSTSLQ